jgi:hypothetical protein
MKNSLRLLGWMLGSAVLAGFAETSPNVFAQIIAPETVLLRAEEMGLSAEQRQAVQRIQGEFQPRLGPLLRQMHQERDALIALLQQEKATETAVLVQFDRLTGVENELKRLRLQMSVRIQAVLAPEQRKKARGVLPSDRLAGSAAMTSGANTLPAKLQRFKQGLEQWKREGRDVTLLGERWERFREAEAKGHYGQARQILDEALALLDQSPPPKTKTP